MAVIKLSPWTHSDRQSLHVPPVIVPFGSVTNVQRVPNGLQKIDDAFGCVYYYPRLPIGSARMSTCLFPRCRSVRRACAHAYSRGADRFDAHAHMLIPALPIDSTRMRTCYRCSSSIERLPTFSTVTTPFIL